MKSIVLASLASLAFAAALVACGGGAYDVTLKRAEDATADDLAKCGNGYYYVAPAAGSTDTHGKCYPYEKAASAP